ncbi:MAG TPA: aspartyl protease family protein [Thermoplasmata archaeon]
MCPAPMGIVHTRVIVFSADLSRREVLDMIVDTGSFLTWVPKETMVKLGHRPSEMRQFRTVDGKVIDRPVCEARIECEGRRASTFVVFARPRDAPVLGAYALEGLGLEVEPSARALKRVDVYLALATG